VAHRDFSASVDEALKNRPSFRVNGIDFLCKPGLQWKSMTVALDAIDTAGNDPAELENGLLVFFDLVLVKSARGKMRELLAQGDDDDDDAVPVSIQQLMEIVRWLVEQYTGTPTQPSSDSSPLPNDTGEPSRADTSTPVVSGPVITADRVTEYASTA